MHNITLAQKQQKQQKNHPTHSLAHITACSPQNLFSKAEKESHKLFSKLCNDPQCLLIILRSHRDLLTSKNEPEVFWERSLTWEAEKEGGCRRAEQGRGVKVRARHYCYSCANIHGASSSGHSQGNTDSLDQSPHVQSHPKNKLLPSSEFKEGWHQAELKLKLDTHRGAFCETERQTSRLV